MSQLIAPTHTFVDNIPLGRRITEIMQEKGPAYTISAMAKRLDISRETLRLLLKGERELYTYELDKIAQDLKVSVERILQSDVLSVRKQIEEMIASFRDIEKGTELIEYLRQLALGLTEKFETLFQIGTYWDAIRDYQKRDETWLEALPLAREILEKFDHSRPLLRVSANLSVTYARRKEKEHLLDLIANTKEFFHENPLQSGIICLSLGRIEESAGELDRATAMFYEYLKFIEIAQFPIQIVKARINVGYFEYRMKNYQKAIEWYTSILDQIDDHRDLYSKCNYYQNFARALIRVNQFGQAEELLTAARQVLDSITVKSGTYAMFEGLQYFLLAITKNEPKYAEQLVEREDLNLTLRKIACKYLIDIYDGIDDVEVKAKFERRIRERFTAIDMILYEKDHDIQYLMTLVDLFGLVGWIE